MKKRKAKTPGAPTKLTPQVQRDFVKVIKLSGFYRDACAAVGIDEKTLANWRERGAAGEFPFVGFIQALQKAETERRLGYLRDSARRGANKNDAKEIQWRAAVTDPEIFSIKHHVIIQQEIDHAIEDLQQEFRNEPHILERALEAISRRSRGNSIGGVAAGPPGALIGGVADANPNPQVEGLRAAAPPAAAPRRAGENPTR